MQYQKFTWKGVLATIIISQDTSKERTIRTEVVAKSISFYHITVAGVILSGVGWAHSALSLFISSIASASI